MGFNEINYFSSGKGERLDHLLMISLNAWLNLMINPLIQHILEAMLSCDMKDISIVGYKADV